METKFQELVRKVSVGLKFHHEEKFRYNGWDSVMAVRLIYNNNWKLEKVFKTIVKEILELKVDVNLNVREHIKKLLMYPSYKYPEFDIIQNEKLRIFLSNINITGKFKIHSGKLYLMITLPKTIVDLAQEELTKEGKPNIEQSHITLVNSNEMVQIKNLEKVKNYVDLMPTVNIKFFKVKGTVSPDYPSYKYVYVAAVKSLQLESEIRKFYEFSDLEYKEKNYHFTFWIIYRNPYEILHK